MQIKYRNINDFFPTLKVFRFLKAYRSFYTHTLAKVFFLSFFFLVGAEVAYANQADCESVESVTINEKVSISQRLQISTIRDQAIRSALLRAIEMVAGVEVYSSSQESVESSLRSIDQSSAQRQVFRSLGRVLEWEQTAEIVKETLDGGVALEVTVNAKICRQSNAQLPVWVAIGEVHYPNAKIVPNLAAELIEEFGRSDVLRLSKGSPEDVFHDVAISAHITVTEELVDNTNKMKLLGQFMDNVPMDPAALRFRLLTSRVEIIATRFFDQHQILETLERKRRLDDPKNRLQEENRLVQETLNFASSAMRERLENGELEP